MHFKIVLVLMAIGWLYTWSVNVHNSSVRLLTKNLIWANNFACCTILYKYKHSMLNAHDSTDAEEHFGRTI